MIQYDHTSDAECVFFRGTFETWFTLGDGNAVAEHKTLLESDVSPASFVDHAIEFFVMIFVLLENYMFCNFKDNP